MATKPLRIVSIPLANITPHPDNPRRASDFKLDHPKMRELVTSITAMGILVPLVVTEHPKQAGHYLLVAGERRWHAAKHCKLATVPGVVHDLTEEEAFTAMLAENLQREDVDPIMEARVVAKMRARGYNLESIAAHFGKSYGWAQKRASIAGLSESWLTHYESSGEATDDQDAVACSIEQLLLIARYDVATQDRLFADLQEHPYQWGRSTSDWSEHLAQFLHEITRAPWDAADATLLPKAGACSTCPTRTSCQRQLWDDVGEGDRCTDHACWEAKTAAHVERRRAEVTAKYGQVINVSTNYRAPEGALGSYDWEQAKKSDPGARPALVVDGTGVGSVKWITVNNRSAAKAAGATDEPTIEERRKGLDKRRLMLTCRAVQEILATLTDHTLRSDDEPASERMGTLPAGTRPPLAALVAWCHVYGVSAVHEYARYEQVLGMSGDDLTDALWAVVAPQMRSSLATVITARQEDSVIPTRIAAAIGVDWNALRAAAATAIPEPKAWRSQFPDAYAQAG